MGEDIQFMRESAETYYTKALEFLKQKDYKNGRIYILKSAELLCKLSDSSTGELKEIYFKKAKSYIEFINELKEHDNQAKSGGDTVVHLSAEKKIVKSNGENELNSEGQMWIAADVPAISFADVAGLDDVKNAVDSKILLPRKFPELYKAFGKSVGGGILMYGAPGTGKTMIAKAIAHEVDAKFYEVKCSDIVGKFFGEAEKNIKSLFATAKKQENAVIFFDEFEALAAKRDTHSSVMKRIIPELLAQMQGFDDSKNTLLLLAATNRPWDLDSAFLRPGRFDERIYVSLPDTAARMFLIEKELKEVPMDSDVNIATIADFTEGFNGADVVNFCDKMKNNAIKRNIEARKISTHEDWIKINMVDVDDVMKKTNSSVSKDDIKKLLKWSAENNNI